MDLIRQWEVHFFKNWKQITRAFIAKAVYNMDTTKDLNDRFQVIDGPGDFFQNLSLC